MKKDCRWLKKGKCLVNPWRGILLKCDYDEKENCDDYKSKELTNAQPKD
jgi:hypothetical protein